MKALHQTTRKTISAFYYISLMGILQNKLDLRFFLKKKIVLDWYFIFWNVLFSKRIQLTKNESERF